MTKSKISIGVMLMGALSIIPMIAFAQEASTSGAAGGTVTTPRPAAGYAHASATGTANAKRLNGLPPGVPVTGTRPMMASGTRPLPPGMEKKMEARDEVHAKMMSSSTQTDCIGDKSGKTDCLGQKRGEEMREKMMERRGEIIKRMANQMIERMNAAIDRLVKLADRIDSRIAKLKEKGVDTTKAEANVAIARTKIADAKAAVALAAGAVESAVASADTSASSTKPLDPGKTVRETLAQARTAVFAAHKAIVDAIESLKAGGEGEHGDKATGTPRMPDHHGSTTTTATGTSAN